MIFKTATSSMLDIVNENSNIPDGSSNDKWEFDKREGMLYVSARAVSANINGNGDFFSHDELKKSYRTFIGKGIFINHDSSNVASMRGKIIDAKFMEHEKPVSWVKLLLEINALAFPDFAQMVKSGHLNSLSMGTKVAVSNCSICNHAAKSTKDYCFTPNTLITMLDGSLKKIQDIEIGDAVLNHLGELSEVLNISKRYVSEELLDINFVGQFESLKCTKEHPIFSFLNKWGTCNRNKCNNPKICKHDEEKQQDFGDFVCAEHLEVGDYLLSPKLINITRELDKEKAELLGYYASEGCVMKVKGKNYVTHFTLHSDEETTIGTRITYLIKKFFNKNTKITRYDYKKCCQFTVFSFDVADWFSKLCPGDARTKKVAGEMLWGGKVFKTALLESLVEGDGHYSEEKNKVYFISASVDLANQTKELANSLGCISTIKKTTFNGGPNNREKKTEGFRVTITPSHTYDIFKNGKMSNMNARSLGKNTPFFSVSNSIAKRVKSIKKFDYEGYVYNLETTNTNSYVANGIGVHNCDHIKFHKGGIFGGKQVYEKNNGIDFFEISFVSQGADSDAKVLEIYARKNGLDLDNLFQKAASSNDPFFMEKLAAEYPEDKEKDSEDDSSDKSDSSEDAGFIKDDQGDVKDKETPSEKIEEENSNPHNHSDNHNSLDDSNPEHIIIIRIQDLIKDAALLRDAGIDNSVVLSELDRWSNYYKEAKINSLKNQYETLLATAEEQLDNHIDCTATLDKIEVMSKKIEAASKTNFYEPKEKKNPNILELPKAKMPGKHKMTPEELQDSFKANSGTGIHKNKKDKRTNNPFKNVED